jgi:glutamine synthetase
LTGLTDKTQKGRQVRGASQESAAPEDQSAAVVTARLAEAGVRAVKLVLVDNAGVQRVKCIPLERLAEAAGSGVGMSSLVSVWLVNDVFTSSAYVGPDQPQDDIRLMPDLASAVPLASEPGWAWCAVDQYDQQRQPWGACPRQFLARMVDELAGHGLRLSGAFETEWYLERPGAPGEPGPQPVNNGPGYSAIATTGASYLLDVSSSLAAAGVDVQTFHAEYSPGQFELSVGPRDAVQAADTVVLVRQTIRGVAEAHGLQALFAPVVNTDWLGSGAHFHLSLWNEQGENIFGTGSSRFGMTVEGEAFVAGVFTELPALVAITAPSVLSYLRLRPGLSAGAYQAWGYENREAALRFVTGMIGSRHTWSNVEYKPIDGSANPYLAIGAIIGAGLAGMRKGLTLPEPTSQAPASLTQAERDRLGLQPLPGTLGEAIDSLRASNTLREAMGEVLAATFLSTRVHEWEIFGQQDPTALVNAHRYRY